MTGCTGEHTIVNTGEAFEPLLSICIPSYNRPEQLKRLLESIDCDPASVEVVIAEDHAPLRAEVRAVVDGFACKSPYRTRYHENDQNLGYDGNIRRLIDLAAGNFVLFMGDDDWFSPGALDLYLVFLERNRDVGYVLRSYFGQHPDGTLEVFKHLPAEKRLPPGPETCTWLYRRSVVICGVTFKRPSALRYRTEQFDGTLLYQLHLVLEICLREEAVYCDIPVAVAEQSYRLDRPQFGTATKERDRFQPGMVTPENSITFTKGFFEITRAFDEKHGLNLTEAVQRDISKYSYPFLSIQRKRGMYPFLLYARRLAQQTGINSSWHFYFYTVALLLLGERVCDQFILRIKRVLGHTPAL
ncbi:MAG: glycosyltransferase family 2 protein [Desulfomonile tiedjei]|nr:glycosyltransferase family 2 protein [Desulfomonile tiedjei]